MKPTKKFIELCHESESCKLRSYQDTGGVWTIGWGHTGPDVVEGVTITQNMADELFYDDCSFFISWLNQQAFNINQNQFDALLDFIYNCGPGGIVNDTGLFKLLKKDPNNKSIASYLRRHIKDKKGKIQPGLIKRREREIALYYSK